MAIPAAIQGVTSVAQLFNANKMQKELGDRVNYEIPEEAKKAYALAQGLASSREMPGQASMQAMMDYQAQKALGTFSRGASGSTDMAALSADIAERQFESQLGLGVQAAKDYQQRQQALYGAMQNMAGYQDKVTADRQKDWYERAEAAAQMKEGGLQNLMGAAKGMLGQLGMMKMMYGGGGTGESMADSFTKASDLPSSIDFSPMSGKNLMKTMMQNRQAAPTASSFATRATQGTYSPSFGFGNRMGKNPSMWDETFPGLYSGLGEFSKPDLSRTTGGYGNNNFNSGFFGADLFNPIY